jgi:hypothetical protein
MSEQAVQHALEVKRRHEDELLRKPNVVAVGVGFRTRAGQRLNEVCIVVSVKQKIPPTQLKRGEAVPAMLENVPVDVIETGPLRAV